ncbi:uncharacterized protein LOC141702133 [Apium graveolens]|uniref:uncharacterized protein LOC141702133 n=1 Tax=Apium graveolens TaxID=4045 RepID=UPI003D79DD0D
MSLNWFGFSSSSANGRPNHIAPSNEVAGLIVTSPYAKGCRDTLIDSRVDGLQRIFETDPRFMQLQYPLLFPHGYIGYYREIPLNRPVKHSKRDVEVTESEDPGEKGLTSHLGGRLWQQYVVDAFTAIEQYRLDWIRDHQTTIRSDLYHNIRDAMQKGDRNPSNIDKAIILPTSFTGCKCYMTQYFKDSLAICRTLGHPSLFLTMTTNTKWPEIQRMLKHMPGVDVADAPDVVARRGYRYIYQARNMFCLRLEMSWRMFTTKAISKKTKLEAWFDVNQTFPNARTYSYYEFPNKFTWYPRPGIWKERKRGDVIGRLSEVHSSSGELLYLRMLLHRKKGSRFFEDLKTVNGHIYETFKEACATLGLLQNDNQWHEAIAENSHTSLSPQLRAMFVNILAYSPISDPLRLWEANWLIYVRRYSHHQATYAQ